MTKEKRTFASVTTVDCTCNYLESAVRDKDSPIRFDSRMNEFKFEYTSSDGVKGSLRIYHCPFCGGAAPASLRATLFATIPSAELGRLRTLTANIKTIQDVLDHLGKPDVDHPAGITITTPANGAQPPTTESFRVLTYLGLSDVAEIHITDYVNKGLRVSYQGKYIGLKGEGD